MEDSRTFPLIVLVLMVGCVVFGYKVGREGAFLPVQTRVEHTTDTLYVRDTITRETPVHVRSFVRDTMFVKITDTLFVELPREVRVYTDSLYYAEVSGYEPSLDYLEIYQKNVVVSKTERAKEKKNYIAVGTELGWCVTPSIPIYLEYTRKLHRNVEFNAGVFHDLVLGETGFRFGVNANISW